MKPAKHISDRIFRNVLLSLFIYALPVLLMLLTFYITGARPWKNPKPKIENAGKPSSLNLKPPHPDEVGAV